MIRMIPKNIYFLDIILVFIDFRAYIDICPQYVYQYYFKEYIIKIFYIQILNILNIKYFVKTYELYIMYFSYVKLIYNIIDLSDCIVNTIIMIALK